MTERTCPHPRCAKVIPVEMYACLPHWRMLPRAIKREISAAWALGAKVSDEPAVTHWKEHRR